MEDWERAAAGLGSELKPWPALVVGAVGGSPVLPDMIGIAAISVEGQSIRAVFLGLAWLTLFCALWGCMGFVEADRARPFGRYAAHRLHQNHVLGMDGRLKDCAGIAWVVHSEEGKHRNRRYVVFPCITQLRFPACSAPVIWAEPKQVLSTMGILVSFELLCWVCCTPRWQLVPTWLGCMASASVSYIFVGFSVPVMCASHQY